MAADPIRLRRAFEINPAASYRGHQGKTRLALRSVISDGFDWAAFLGFLATRFFFRRLRLFGNVRIAAVLVAFEIVGRSFAAQVAVDALIIDIVLAKLI